MRIRQRYLAISGVLITLSVLCLLNNFGLLDSVDFNYVLYFWPLILISVALYLLFRGRKITYWITGVSSVALGVLLFASYAVYSVFVPFLPRVGVYRVSKINPNIQIISGKKNIFEKIDRANLIFKSEKGDYYLRGTATNSLTEYESKSTFGEYLYDVSEKDGIKTISLIFDKERIPWKIISEKNSLDLKLNPQVKWSLEFDIESSSLDMDLGYYQVSRLVLNLSGSKAKVNIDASTIQDSMSISISGSTSSVELVVDSSVGVEVKPGGVLLRSELGDLESVSSGVFRSRNFDSATKKLYIESDLKLSSLELQRN